MQIWRAKFETVSLAVSSPQNSIRPPRKKNIPLHTVVVRSLPTFQCFTLLPSSLFMLNENFQQNASKFAIF